MGTIGPPRHVENAQAAARMNPVSALFAAPAQAVQHKQQQNRGDRMEEGGISKKKSNGQPTLKINLNGINQLNQYHLSMLIVKEAKV